MRHEVRKLDLKLTASTAGSPPANRGTAMRIEDLIEAAVVLGTPAGVAPVGVTVSVQASVNGSDFTMNEWVVLASIANAAIIAGSVTPIPAGYTKVRLVTSVYGSGLVVGAVSGKNSRTDGG